MLREQWVITEQGRYHLEAAWQVEGSGSWYTASVKEDGCLEFRRFFNDSAESQSTRPEDDRMYDQIHFCDLDDEIARLTALRDMARAAFAAQQETDHAED